MVEDLLDKLDKLETNFTIVDEAVPSISSATRVSQNIRTYTCMYVRMYVQAYVHMYIYMYLMTLSTKNAK